MGGRKCERNANAGITWRMKLITEVRQAGEVVQEAREVFMYVLVQTHVMIPAVI